MQKLDENELSAVTGGRDEEYFDSSETTAHSKRNRGLLASCFSDPKGQLRNRGFPSSSGSGDAEHKDISR